MIDLLLLNLIIGIFQLLIGLGVTFVNYDDFKRKKAYYEQGSLYTSEEVLQQKRNTQFGVLMILTSPISVIAIPLLILGCIVWFFTTGIRNAAQAIIALWKWEA